MKRFNVPVRAFFRKNGSTILTCLGVAGTIGTTVMAVKATPKAMALLEAKKKEKGSDLTVVETIQTAAPVYIPSLIIGASTITCIFGANVLNKRQQASLASCYALIENSYKEYRNKLKELYGVEADQKIVDQIAREKAYKVYFSSHGMCSVDDLADDEDAQVHTFYDEFSGRYFESTFLAVKNAEYHLNRNLAIRGFCDLDEFHKFLGIESDDEDLLFGWNQWEMLENGLEGGWIDFDHRKVTLDDGMECYIIEMPYGPTRNYEDY